MIAFAFVDDRGIPTGGGILRALPDGAVPLPEPFSVSDLPRLHYRDGGWHEREELQTLPAPKPSPQAISDWEAAMLARTRAVAVDRINARVADIRKHVITDIPGQDTIYREKRAEAASYVAEASLGGQLADLSAYPWLRAETGITAPTAWQLAQTWLNLSDQAKRICDETERIRMTAIARIRKATTYEEIARNEAATEDEIATFLRLNAEETE